MMAVDSFFRLNGNNFRSGNRQNFNDGSAVMDKSWRKTIVSLDPDDAAELYGYPRDKEEVEHEEASLVTAV
jgi:hypothetical protein